MDSFKIYSREDVDSRFSKRPGEVRIGEKVKVVSSFDDLESTAAQFVLLGIPEDIGVRANAGVGGASSTWMPALSAFLSAQSNAFLAGDNIIVLGHFELESADNASLGQLRSRVAEIDALVYPVIEKIAAAGKVPVIIGGGHNNAYPIIKGCSLGLGSKINTVNIDAHADLRPTGEGRHSGNGFSAAIESGCLDHYHVFGLHESYNNQYILDKISGSANIHTFFFDELLRSGISTKAAWTELTKGILSPCGLEIDLDSISNVLSSAISPSGFTVNEIRSLILSAEIPFSYLHICEGAVALKDGRTDATTAKLVAYLVGDFVKRNTL